MVGNPLDEYEMAIFNAAKELDSNILELGNIQGW